MPFDATVTRLHSGVTLDMIHQRLVEHTISSGTVDDTQVWPVLDDEVLPSELPSQGRFITVRLPSLTWEYGDVMIGNGDVGEFIVSGQTRITLWLRNELDYHGKIMAAVDEAVAPPPRGTKMLGRLIRHFHETDLLNDDGDAITKRPMMFVSYEPPAPGARDWKPFRVTFELTFTWDLSQEV